jgi:DNA-directed RNA polymerase subunit omega
VARILPALFPTAQRPVSHRHMSSQLLDEAQKVVPSQQLLVNIVSKRVRQLSSGHRPMVEFGPREGWADIALKEIIEGKLKYELVSAERENGG